MAEAAASPNASAPFVANERVFVADPKHNGIIYEAKVRSKFIFPVCLNCSGEAARPGATFPRFPL